MEILVYLVSSVQNFVENHRSEHYVQACKSAFLILLLANSFPVEATSFKFDLRGGDAAIALDGMNSGQIVNNDLIAGFLAGPDATLAGIFNQTSTRFGINSLGTTNDSPSLIDSASGISENLAISFSETVKVDQLTLSLFTPVEIAKLLYGDGSSVILTGLALAQDVYKFSDITLDIGEPLILSHVSGNGFSLDSITVSSIEVSEPDMLILLVLGAVCVLTSRRRLL